MTEVKQGQYLESAQYQREAISLNPNMALAHWWLAFALYQLDRHDEAGAACQTAVMLEPSLAHNNPAPRSMTQ